ncbi:MAG: hypothetical protein ACRENB_08050 [Gemmatimonadales bacterium]
MRTGSFGTLFVLCLAAPTLDAQVQATVYPDGRVFVRRTIVAQIPRGVSDIPLPFEDGVAGSFVSLDSGVTILAVRGPRAGDPVSLVRRAAGRRVVFRGASPGDTVSALVLSADPPRYQLSDGSVVQSLPGTLMYPDELAGAGHLARLTVRSERARSLLEIGYVVFGASWHAHYVLSLEGRRGRLESYAVIMSDALQVDSARVTVLAGSIPRFIPPASFRTPDERARFIQQARQAALDPGGSGGEPILAYAVPGRHTIGPAETVSLPLHPPVPVSVDRFYRIENPANQPTRPSPGAGTAISVVSGFRVTSLGPAPEAGWPAGTARIYETRPEGARLTGEALVDVSDRAEPLEISFGVTGEVRAHRSEVSLATEQDTTLSPAGSRLVRPVATIVEYSIRLENTADSARIVEIDEFRSDEWTVLASSVPSVATGPRRRRFDVRLAPRSDAMFRLRARVSAR